MNKLIITLVLALLAAPTLANKESPFLIEKKEYKNRVKIVSLAPLDVAPGLDLTPEMHQFIETEAAKQLDKTKVDAIAIEPYARIRDMMVQQVGGITNAEGQVLVAKQRIVWDHAKREMRHRHQMDAFAQISIRPVSAVFSDDRAEWDGVKQKVKASGDGFSLFGGKNYQGTIGALSFQLAMIDRNDELLFVNRGGIEVLQERQGGKLVPLDSTVLMQDEKKIKKAIQLAFKPL